MSITVSAPGKIHLMGEHAVVHGSPALLTAIDRRLTVRAEPADEFTIEADNRELKAYMRYAAGIVASAHDLASLPAVRLSVTSDILYGHHLGSSAAVAVATVATVTYAAKRLWNPQAINKLAYEVEKKQHGNPSGGDNTVVTFGGFVWYRKELEFLKSMWQLPLRPHKSLRGFYLINTGKPIETTGEMVALVAENVKKNKKKMRELFWKNEEQTKRIAIALKSGEVPEVISAITEGERTLEEMGVVSSPAQKCIRDIENSGGAAKILGGGGSRGPVGYLLAYHTDTNALKNVCTMHGFSPESVKLGEDGVRLESGKTLN